MDTLKDIKFNWDEFARADPLWSIFPHADKKGSRWRLEEFFKTGKEEIKSLMEYIESRNFKIKRDRALDFGCGVGRLTQALVQYFNECYGVDISSSMLELADKYNKYGSRCKYILNCTDDLKIFKNETFDFIYSNIVFQHMPPVYTLEYIKEFLRIINHDGIIIFLTTTEELPLIGTKVRQFLKMIISVKLRRFYKRLKYGTWAIKEMYCIKKEVLDNFIKSNGGRIIEITSDKSALPRYKALRYFIAKY